MILGDSLQVMASLAEREKLRGKVQMVYIDPPYGIKFGSNWQVSTRNRDVQDGKMEDAAREAEQIKAFRDTWELGIHSYLSYLRDRLLAARDLLDRVRLMFRPDRRRERSPGSDPAGRGLRFGELHQPDHVQDQLGGARASSWAARPTSCFGTPRTARRREVPTALPIARQSAATETRRIPTSSSRRHPTSARDAQSSRRTVADGRRASIRLQS